MFEMILMKFLFDFVKIFAKKKFDTSTKTVQRVFSSLFFHIKLGECDENF